MLHLSNLKSQTLLFLTLMLASALGISAPVFDSDPITSLNGNPKYLYSIFVSDLGTGEITAPTKPAWLTLNTEDEFWYTGTFAGGEGTVGFVDGAASVSRFKNMYGIAIDSSGDMYIADTHNHAIRHIDGATGAVTTIGGDGTSGHADGSSAESKFFFPQGIAVDADDNIYVADAFNHCIRRIDADDFSVTTLAGNPGTSGMQDGTGSAALLNQPKGVAVDDDGLIWIADSGNHQIKTLTAAGLVTTVAGAADGSSGNLDGASLSTAYNSPRGMSFGPDGKLYIADKDNHLIRSLDPDTFITDTIAGNGSAGDTDAIGESAVLNHPFDVTLDSEGNIFFPDSSNHKIKKIDASTDAVTTIAGDGFASFSDGTAELATFYFPRSLELSANGNIYVSDRSNGSIREMEIVDALLRGTAPSSDSYPVALLATVEGEEPTPQDFTIIVESINQRPEISGSPVGALFEGEPYNFTPTASDADEDSLTFSIAMKPSWATFDESTGNLSGTPGYTDAKMNVHVAISVDDGTKSDNARRTLAPFNILVKNTNRAPTISGTPSASIFETESFSFAPTIADEDTDDTLTLSVENLPEWLSFNESTGEVSGTSAVGDAGVYENITITVTDSSPNSNNATSFSFSVEVETLASSVELIELHSLEQSSSGKFTLLYLCILSLILFRRIR